MIRFLKNIEVSLKKPVCRNKSDNGAKFKNYALDSFFINHGISYNISSPHTPQHNAVLERRNPSFCEAAGTMLTYENLTKYYWAKATSTTCFTQNRSFIYQKFNITPYEE